MEVSPEVLRAIAGVMEAQARLIRVLSCNHDPVHLDSRSDLKVTSWKDALRAVSSSELPSDGVPHSAQDEGEAGARPEHDDAESPSIRSAGGTLGQASSFVTSGGAGKPASPADKPKKPKREKGDLLSVSDADNLLLRNRYGAFGVDDHRVYAALVALRSGNPITWVRLLPATDFSTMAEARDALNAARELLASRFLKVRLMSAGAQLVEMEK
jgi:hypothetical protein